MSGNRSGLLRQALPKKLNEALRLRREQTRFGHGVHGYGLADLEAYGQMVLANPDFVARVKVGAAMNDANPKAFFGGDGHGYIDYPALAEAGEP